MKPLTIHTYKYKDLIINFADDNDIAVRSTSSSKCGLFSIHCLIKPNDSFIEGFMELLITIALEENPIFNQSPKLRSMADDLRSTPLYVALSKDIKTFIKKNNNLHLEGYVTFRMTEYGETLDLMSYTLIKKMNLIQQD
ncbi:MAG: hypothetical protein FWE11_06375 [Defluviitaleaceae bacterium]|nr:hypothetical protein [Defluviitaleaceae bacterium]